MLLKHFHILIIIWAGTLSLLAEEGVIFSIAPEVSAGSTDQHVHELRVETQSHTLFSSLVTLEYVYPSGSSPTEITVSSPVNGVSVASNTAQPGSLQAAFATANGVSGNVLLARVTFSGAAPDAVSLKTVQVNEGGTASVIENITTVNISGHVYLRGNAQRPVEGVRVSMQQGASLLETTTGSDGAFSFEANAGESIELSASLETESVVARGVDVVDIVAMRNHILGRARLPDYVSMIASDANRDASIDVVDIVALRNLILGRKSFFSKNPSDAPESLWRFFKSDTSGLGVSESLSLAVDREKVALIPSASQSDIVLIAVKLGDSNADW